MGKKLQKLKLPGMNRITRLFCFPPLRLNNPAGNNKISMLLPMIGVISIAFSLGFAYALPLEDYSETRTKKSIDKILKFCGVNANTTLTNETIMSLNLSQFYSDYTCD